MKSQICCLVCLSLMARLADSKHHQLRGEFDQSFESGSLEVSPDKRQRHLHKKNRHGHKQYGANYGRAYYGDSPPTQQYYYGPNRYGQTPYQNYYGKRYVIPPQYYYSKEQYDYDRYYQQYYYDYYQRYEYIGGPYEWSQSCRDCKKACYGFECSLTCCHKPKPEYKPSCQDCNEPCYGDECLLQCCGTKDENNSLDFVGERNKDTCYTCEENNPCTVGNIEQGHIYHHHCDPGRFIECDDYSECVELPMSLWDLLVSEHVSGGESQ